MSHLAESLKSDLTQSSMIWIPSLPLSSSNKGFPWFDAQSVLTTHVLACMFHALVVRIYSVIDKLQNSWVQSILLPYRQGWVKILKHDPVALLQRSVLWDDIAFNCNVWLSPSLYWNVVLHIINLKHRKVFWFPLICKSIFNIMSIYFFQFHNIFTSVKYTFQNGTNRCTCTG